MTDVGDPPRDDGKCYTYPRGKRSTNIEHQREFPKNKKYCAHIIKNIFEGISWINLISLIAAIAALYSATVARNQLIATQRAVITINGLDIQLIDGDQGDKKWWRISPIIKNSGNTPTKNMRFTTTVGDINFDVVRRGPRFPKSDLASATANRGTLGAQQETRILIQTLLDGSYSKSILEHNIAPYIYGAIVYEDFPSGETHITRYCYSLFSYPRINTGGTLSYSFCGRNTNCSDEECGKRDQQDAESWKPID